MIKLLVDSLSFESGDMFNCNGSYDYVQTIIYIVNVLFGRIFMLAGIN